MALRPGPIKPTQFLGTKNGLNCPPGAGQMANTEFSQRL